MVLPQLFCGGFRLEERRLERSVHDHGAKNDLGKDQAEGLSRRVVRERFRRRVKQEHAGKERTMRPEMACQEVKCLADCSRTSVGQRVVVGQGKKSVTRAAPP